MVGVNAHAVLVLCPAESGSYLGGVEDDWSPLARAVSNRLGVHVGLRFGSGQ